MSDLKPSEQDYLDAARACHALERTLTEASSLADYPPFRAGVDAAFAAGVRAMKPPLHVWAVAFSNYEPAEVAALYDNEAAAQQHADALDGDWRVVRWNVQSSPTVRVELLPTGTGDADSRDSSSAEAANGDEHG